MNLEFTKDDYILSTDKKKLNTTIIHRVLSSSEWTKGITFDTVKRSIKKSVCFGLYREGKQVGFARIVSDHATIAYISDSFIVNGNASDEIFGWMIDRILEHPELKDVKNWLIKSLDEFGVYEKLGFVKYDEADKILIKRNK